MIEALAIIFGVKRFHQYLFGRRFTLLTDHEPPTYILVQNRGSHPSLRLFFSGGPFNWQLIHTIVSIVHPSTMDMLMRYRACQGILQKKQMIGRWRETKSTGSKSRLHLLQPVELERLQEAIQSFHVSLAWLARRRKYPGGASILTCETTVQNEACRGPEI